MVKKKRNRAAILYKIKCIHRNVLEVAHGSDIDFSGPWAPVFVVVVNGRRRSLRRPNPDQQHHHHHHRRRRRRRHHKQTEKH